LKNHPGHWRAISLTGRRPRVDTLAMSELRASKATLLLAGTVLFLAVLSTSVGVTAAVKGSSAWSALPVGWIAVWVTALLSITAYLAWAETTVDERS
jgi:hypothetical protein